MHVAAARLGCKRTMVGTRWVNSRPGCMSRLRKRYSHLKVKVTSLLVKAGSGVGFSLGVRAWTEMEIWCVKGMFRLKLISSEKNSG